MSLNDNYWNIFVNSFMSHQSPALPEVGDFSFLSYYYLLVDTNGE
jgi:hypothetical protein